MFGDGRPSDVSGNFDGIPRRNAGRERIPRSDGRRSLSCGGLLLIVLAGLCGLGILGSLFDDEGSSNRSATSTSSSKRKPEDWASAWDGSIYAVNAAVKERLKDPGSFKHVETKWTASPLNAGYDYGVVMTYRAKNSFGALVLGTARGTLDAKTGEFTLTSAE